jgi:hypothetical protein
MITEAFGGDGDPALNLNIVVQMPPRNPYAPGDQPAYLDDRGPSCSGLDDIDGLIADTQAGTYYCPDPPADGIDSPEDPLNGPRCTDARRTGDSSASGQQTATGTFGDSVGTSLTDGGTRGGLAGSSAELAFVRGLLAYQTGQDPADVSDLSASQLAPLLRGTQVMIP